MHFKGKLSWLAPTSLHLKCNQKMLYLKGILIVQKKTHKIDKKRGATNFTQADIQFQQLSIHKIYIIMQEKLSELHCNFSAIPKKGYKK